MDSKTLRVSAEGCDGADIEWFSPVAVAPVWHLLPSEIKAHPLGDNGIAAGNYSGWGPYAGVGSVWN